MSQQLFSKIKINTTCSTHRIKINCAQAKMQKNIFSFHEIFVHACTQWCLKKEKTGKWNTIRIKGNTKERWRRGREEEQRNKERERESVCVCVCERERDREGERERERARMLWQRIRSNATHHSLSSSKRRTTTRLKVVNCAPYIVFEVLPFQG